MYFSNEFCPDGNHPHLIDLGLPSGTKWACCNVGASVPTDCGNYFAWGETAPKASYNWDNYKWCKKNGDNIVITKYHYNVDGKSRLDPEDDAATANWGGNWKMPSYLQIQELLDNCTNEDTKVNGVSGRVFKSNINDKSVFFPATGYRYESSLYLLGSVGEYWSCVAYDTTPYSGGLFIEGGGIGSVFAGKARCVGMAVRPVSVAQE